MEQTNDRSQALNPKLLIIAGGGILFLLILIFVLLAAAKKKPSSHYQTVPGNSTGSNSSSGFSGGTRNNQQPHQTANTTPSVGISVSTSVLKWINTQRQPNNIYFSTLICDGTHCQTQVTDNRTGLYVAWARYRSYIRTHEVNQMTDLTKDLNTLSDKNTIPVIQDSYLGCKLLYEMAQNSIFTEVQKTQIKNICFRSTNYPLFELDSVKSDLSNLVMPSNDEFIDTVMNNKQLPLDSQNFQGTFTEYSTASSNYSARYLWTHDVTNLKIAKVYFNKSLALYSNNKIAIGDTSTLLGSAAIDLFKATHDNKYLSFTYFIYKNLSTNPCSTEDGCIGTLILTQQLSDLLHETKYKDAQVKATAELLRNHYDDSKFYFTVGTSKIYSTRANALLVGELLQQ